MSFFIFEKKCRKESTFMIKKYCAFIIKGNNSYTSHFSIFLDMHKNGYVELQQTELFGDIHIHKGRISWSRKYRNTRIWVANHSLPVPNNCSSLTSGDRSWMFIPINNLVLQWRCSQLLIKHMNSMRLFVHSRAGFYGEVATREIFLYNNIYSNRCYI